MLSRHFHPFELQIMAPEVELCHLLSSHFKHCLFIPTKHDYEISFSIKKVLILGVFEFMQYHRPEHCDIMLLVYFSLIS